MFRWTLTYQGNSIVATDDPVGWENVTIQYIRSAKYFGIFKEVSEDLGFFCNGGGGDFIKDAYENEAFEADVEVLVEFQCSDGESYDVILDGRVSMDSYRVEQLNDADIVYVKLENNDLAYKIMSRDSIPINLKSLIGLDGQALTAYTFDSNTVSLARILQIASRFTNTNTATYNAIGSVTPSSVHIGVYIPSTSSVQTDLLTVNDNEDQWLFQQPPLSGSFADWLIQYGTLYYTPWEATETDVQKWPSLINVQANVSGTFYDPNPSALNRVFDVAFNIYVGPDFYTALQIGTYFSSPIVSISGTAPAGASFNYPAINFNIGALPEGYKIYPVFMVLNYVALTGSVGGNPVQFQFTIDNFAFTITCANEFPASNINTLLIHEAFSRQLESISGQSQAFYSSLLGRKNSQPYAYSSNGCHSFIAVTNGLSVRGKTVPITTSFEEMYDSIEAIGNVGIGIEGDPNGGGFTVARLEEKSYFFDSNTLLLTLTGLQRVTETVWEQEIFNEAEVGYNEWQPFAVTGLDEPLTRQTYINVIKNIKSKFSALCVAIMSMNLIEIIRRFGTTQNITQDLAQDEKLIWVALSRSVDASGNPNNLTTPEKNENFSSISNLTQPATALNLRYSPKRNLARHLNRLAASLLKVSTAFRYASGEGNQDMTSTMIADGCAGDYSGRLLTEDAAIRWDDQYVRNNVPLFEPILYDFTHPLSYTEYKTIKANTKGYIRGVCADGTVIEGFVKQIDYTIEKGIADITLIKKYEN